MTFRYIDHLRKEAVPDYVTIDARIASMYEPRAFAAIGQNLMDKQHQQYLALIPRTI